jgi:hypothetical protein
LVEEAVEKDLRRRWNMDAKAKHWMRDLLWNALGCVAIGVCGSSLKKLFLGYGYIE